MRDSILSIYLYSIVPYTYNMLLSGPVLATNHESSIFFSSSDFTNHEFHTWVDILWIHIVTYFDTM